MATSKIAEVLEIVRELCLEMKKMKKDQKEIMKKLDNFEKSNKMKSKSEDLDLKKIINDDFGDTLRSLDAAKLNEKMDTLNFEFEKIINSNTMVLKKISTLRCNNDENFVKIDVEKFNSRIDDLNADFKEVVNSNSMVLNQISTLQCNNNEKFTKYACDISIKGIPEMSGEHLLNVFNQICSHIRFDCNQFPFFVKLFRVGQRSDYKHRVIIVKFSSKLIRDLFFDAYLNCHDIKCCDIGFNCNNRVYIGEYMSSGVKKIFEKCVILKKEKIVEKVFAKNGTVNILLPNTTTYLKINSIAQFSSLFPSASGLRISNFRTVSTSNTQ